MTILDAMHDPALFGSWFKDRASWRAWEVFLSGLFGLPMESEAAAIYSRHTGRATTPPAPAREGWVIVGRRGGKSRIAALVAVYLACFRDYRDHLAPGEVGTLPVIAADRRQARTVMGYITGFIDNVPMLKTLVRACTKESIELANRVNIEVHTASFRAVRGYTVVAAVADEVAFWRTDDGSSNPDVEIIGALKPAMATIPGALLIAISSPYARRGALWEAYRRHFGQDGPVLVWQADTRSMNPGVDPQVIADAYAADEAAAAAEYGAEFRRDIESFVSREAVEACMIPERRELPPVSTVEYVGFVDPSGGSADSMTLAIAHTENGRAVLDCVRERKPPFNPADVAAEFATILNAYGVSSVGGDRYAGEWPRERFREHGISYVPAEKPKSDLYRELLPMVNSGQVELLDHPRLLAQLCGLERRTARSGRDSIDHAPNTHDDVANAVAGVLVTVARRPDWSLLEFDDESAAVNRRSAYQQQIEQRFPYSFEPPSTETCASCVNFCDRGPGAPGYCELRLRDGVAQIEDVEVLERFRGRGLGRAIVQHALDEGRASADVVFLEALADDWPRELYARLGFVAVDRSDLYTRLPHALTRLHLRTPRLELRLGTIAELRRLFAVASDGAAPGGLEEGPFIALHERALASWRADEWALHLIGFSGSEPIGSETLGAAHFAKSRTVTSDGWLGRAWQGQGFEDEMRAAALTLAFDGLGARKALVDRGREVQRDAFPRSVPVAIAGLDRVRSLFGGVS